MLIFFTNMVYGGHLNKVAGKMLFSIKSERLPLGIRVITHRITYIGVTVLLSLFICCSAVMPPPQSPASAVFALKETRMG